MRLLDAEEAAQQDLPAQNTRDAALKTFASDPSPSARSLRARAGDATSDGAPADEASRKRCKDFPHDPELVLERAKALEAAGEGEKAIALLKDYVKTDDQDARAWFLLGHTSILQGDVQPAVDDYLVRALVLNSRAGDLAAEAETRNAQGYGFERLGQLDYAIEQYTRAAAIREKIGDKRGMVKSLRNLAIAQAVKGDRAAASANLDKVKTLLEGMGDRASLADLYNDRGVVAEEQGDFNEALALYREALAIRRQLDVPAGLAESLNNVGFASYQLGQFDNAEVYWQQALALYQKLDDSNRQIGITQDLGLLDLARGHFAAARERMESSLATAEASQLVEESAVAHTNLAELALAEGNYGDAAKHAARAEDAFKRRSDRRGQIEANLIDARIALATGALDAADKALAAIPDDTSICERAARGVRARDRAARVSRRRREDRRRKTRRGRDAREGRASGRRRVPHRHRARAAGARGRRREIGRSDHPGALRGDDHARPGAAAARARSSSRSHRRCARATSNDAALRYRDTLPLLQRSRPLCRTRRRCTRSVRARCRPAPRRRRRWMLRNPRARALLADAPADAKATLEHELDLRLEQDVGDAR